MNANISGLYFFIIVLTQTKHKILNNDILLYII